VNSRCLVMTSLALLAAAGAGGAQQSSAAGAGPVKQAPRETTAGRATTAAAPKAAVVIEAESLLTTAVVSYQAQPPIRQEMGGYGPGWSANAQLFWRPPAPVDSPTRNWPHVKLHPRIAASGTYAVRLVYTQAPDFGNARVFVNGQARGDLAGHAPTVRTARIDLGDVALRAGNNEVLVTVFGKADQSTGFAIGLDRLEVTRK